LCRNPDFKEGSAAPWSKDEFVPCDQISAGSGQDREQVGSPSSGTQDIQF